MFRSSSVCRGVFTAAAAAILALSACLSAAASAQAETSGPTPQLCLVNCVPADAETKDPGKGKPTEPAADPAPPAPPPAPAPPAPEAPAPAPALAPEPAASPAEEGPTGDADAASASATPSAGPSTASPSSESNWNKPITRSAEATPAGAVSRNDGSGLFGSPGLLAIMGGVLLVGLAGLAFAWWSRNRLSSH